MMVEMTDFHGQRTDQGQHLLFGMRCTASSRDDSHTSETEVEDFP